MNDLSSKSHTGDDTRASASGERVVCVIAKDVLSLERQATGFNEELLSVLRRGRWWMLGFILGCGLLAVAYSLLATEWYLAEAVLAPAVARNEQGLAAQLGSVGLLAAVAGLNLEGTNTSEPIAVLKSREFARQFIEQQGLLHVLLWNAWDAKAGRWKELDPKRQPDIRDAIRIFDKSVLQVQEDKKTGLVTVGIQWMSATVAASWANTIVDQLNEQMRLRALAEGEANIAYLQNELTTTNIVPVQQAIARLLESQLQRVMVARGRKEFAFRVVDPAAVPKWRSWPKRTAVVALGLLAGGLVGLFAVFVRELLGRKPTDRTVTVST